MFLHTLITIGGIKMYYTGIDLHKSTSYLTTVDSSGNFVQQQNIKNVEHNFVQYFKSLHGKH